MLEGRVEKRALLGDFEAVPLPEFEGVKYPSFFSFRQKGIEAHLKDIRDFESRKSDIILCSYPKSGTHWMREMIALLISQDAKLQNKNVSTNMFEFEPDLSTLSEVEPPRLFNTHLTSKYLPKHHIENGGKIIHLLRNPKDVSVSAYNHYRRDLIVDLDITWDEFFNLWIDKKLPFATWYEHARDYDIIEQSYPELVHRIYFEDIKQNPNKEITRLANFLNIHCTTKLAEQITTVTKFDYMKHNKKDISKERTVDGKGCMYRKGEIGDWKNWFTVSQNDRFDQQYYEEMKDVALRNPFEPYMC